MIETVIQTSIGTEGERAVSPIVGAILMVAITVILAAVVATFVLDISDPGETAPTANIEFDTDPSWGDLGSGIYEIGFLSHGGGDDISTEDITITVEGDVEETLDADNSFTDDTGIGIDNV